MSMFFYLNNNAIYLDNLSSPILRRRMGFCNARRCFCYVPLLPCCFPMHVILIFSVQFTSTKKRPMVKVVNITCDNNFRFQSVPGERGEYNLSSVK